MHAAQKAWMDEHLPITNRENAARRIQLKSSRIPFRFYEYYDKGWGFFDKKHHGVVEDIRGWIAEVAAGRHVHNSGRGLILWGKPGHGKTTLACVTLMELILTVPLDVWGHSPENHLRVTGYYSPYADFIENQKRLMSVPSDSEEFARLTLEQDIVYAREKRFHGLVTVLDDIGKEYKGQTGWAVSSFDHLVRRRYDIGLPTIVTTNHDPAEWAGVYSPAMASFASEAFDSYPIVDAMGDRR